MTEVTFVTQTPEVVAVNESSRDQKRPAALSPTAMPLPEAVRVLSKTSGQSVTEEMLRSDIENGAPTNTDGTLNLVHYAAWLVKEMSNSGD